MTGRVSAKLKCAHLRVAYFTETVNGLAHGWWECSSECGTKFVPLTAEAEQRQHEAFRQGVAEGLRKYAWWKDGIEYVGTCGATLQAALAELERE